jgi:dTDP-L-rhamnose 4-epimerase
MSVVAGICLITGGAGFIGVRTRKALAETFDKVVVVDAFVDQVHGSVDRLESDEIGPVFQARLQDPDQYGWLAGLRPDVVIHLAAETGTAQSMSESALHVGSNSLGTATLLDALLAHDAIPEQFVLASSRAVYGEGGYEDETHQLVYPGIRSRQQLEDGKWAFPGLTSIAMNAERIDARPASIYGATKLNQEHLLTAWSSAYGSDVAIVRLQNVYGAGQAPNNPYTGILPLFFKIARAGQSIPLYEDGLIVRDFVHVSDVVRAITGLARDRVSGTWDIGAGTPTTISDVAGLVASMARAPQPQVTGQYRVGDVRSAVADITAAQRDLGWSPTISLREGLEELDRWLSSGSVASELQGGLNAAR